MKFVIRPIEESNDNKPWLSATPDQIQRTRYEDPLVVGGKVQIDLTDDELKWIQEQTGYNVTRTCPDIREHDFWGKKGLGLLTLEPYAKVMDDKNPMDLIQLGLARASDTVCNKQKDGNPGICPGAMYELISDGDDVVAAASAAQQRAKAYAEYIKMTNAQKVHILALLGKENATGQSQEYIDMKVEQLVRNQTEEFLLYTNMDKKEVQVRSVIEMAIMNRIFVRQGTQVVYDDLVIGYDKEEAVAYLMDPQNQKFWLHLVKKVNEE
jgi:hypothetical protein